VAKEDLKPVQSKEEAKERGRKGGIASGKARREKKLMRETLDIILSMPMKNGKNADVESIRSFAALKGKNISVQEAILIAQVQKAMKGDTKAAEYVRDTVGQKPVDNVVMSGEVNNPFAELTTEELKKMVYDG
jgi:hypothetical protein